MNSCESADEDCTGGPNCLNIKLPKCKYALVSGIDEGNESKTQAGAYVIAPYAGVGNAGHIYGVVKNKMGGSDATVWKDANSDETWSHTCKEKLR